MENKTEAILNSIYKSYGSDSGILLGIKDKEAVKAIIEFTLSRYEQFEDTEIKKLREERDLLIDALGDNLEHIILALIKKNDLTPIKGSLYPAGKQKEILDTLLKFICKEKRQKNY